MANLDGPKPLLDGEAARRVLRWLPVAMLGHLFVGVPALVISLVVAWGTYVQATATQRMQQAAAWPFVAYYTSNFDAQDRHRIELTLVNNGVGPAVLGPIELRYKGQPMRDAETLLTSCCGYRSGQTVSFGTNAVPGSVLRPGERIEFFVMNDTGDNARIVKALERERYAIDVRSCYCSIFDDCWTIRGARAKPQAVNRCPANWTPYGDLAMLGIRSRPVPARPGGTPLSIPEKRL